LKARGLVVVVAALVTAAGVAFLLRSAQPTAGEVAGGAPARGGTLIATYRTEPRTFNRYSSATVDTELFARLTQATLVRINRSTTQVEPRLASSWTTSADGLTWTLKLREGVTFSDGTPLTASDVLFSLRALYDERTASQLAGALLIDGRPIAARALDAQTVVLTLPAPYAPGLALLDALPILPEHKLRAALEAGTFRDAWGTSTDPGEIVGLGPFVLREYLPGQRIVFERNTRFWLRDDDGEALPYLDAIELHIVPDHNGEMLRLQAGEVDLTTDRIRPEDMVALERLEQQQVVRLMTAGVSISPEMLWFNLDPGAAGAATRPWLQRDELRRAISCAVDRQAVVNTVYLGAAEPIDGPITPGHGEWFVPELPRTEHDDARARTLLASIGLSDRNGDGRLEDTEGQPARFSITTQKGNSFRERLAAVVQQELSGVGLVVDVVAAERNALISQWSTGAYDAILFGTEFSAFDPGRNPEFWLSSGGFHVWNAGQAKPATDWEARIDELMGQQMRTSDSAERRRLFAEVQRIFSEHLPVLYFAAPRVVVATSARLRGATPSVLSPPILWNAERLALAPGDRPARQ
jgi:peptide/nickel transport system substrate-binding protein